MKQFTYTITDPVGIHVRPAGLLVKAIEGLDSTVTVEGGDEEANCATLAKFFADNL